MVVVVVIVAVVVEVVLSQRLKFETSSTVVARQSPCLSQVCLAAKPMLEIRLDIHVLARLFPYIHVLSYEFKQSL